MSSALPDPVDFAADALLAGGALVERDADGWFAVLPNELAQELGVGEECWLAAGSPVVPRTGLLPCGIGTPILERLAGRIEGTAPLATVRLVADPPRVTQARALVERFEVRNAPIEFGDAVVRAATYLIVWLAWSAEADDRYDGIVQAGICLEDQGAADPGLLGFADPLGAAWRLRAVPLPFEAAAVRRGLSLTCARAAPALDAPLANVRSLVARRLRRDHDRITDYFDQLARDTRTARRRVDAAAVEAKLAHLLAERDAKLRALAERYRLRVSLAPLALLLLDVPAIRVRVRVRRRKREGELHLRLAPGADAFDRLACAGCSGATARPLVCDERLHVLCELCVPSAQGRPVCAVCRGPE